MNISKYSDEFIHQIQTTKNLSEKSVIAYSYDLNQFFNVLKQHKIYHITTESIIDYIHHLQNDLHLKDTSIQRKIITLKMYFRFLEENYHFANPCTKLKFKFKQEKKLPRILTVREVHRLLNVVKNASLESKTEFEHFRFQRDLALVDLLISTGIRIGEAAKIELSDIIFSERVILIHGKGRKQRLIYISCKETWKHLLDWISVRNEKKPDCRNLFLNKYGDPLSIHSMEDLFKKYRDKANINRSSTPHYLRHTFATNLLTNGADIRSVQEILGHSSISTTEIYLEVSNTHKKQVLSKYNFRNKLSDF